MRDRSDGLALELTLRAERRLVGQRLGGGLGASDGALAALGGASLGTLGGAEEEDELLGDAATRADGETAEAAGGGGVDGGIGGGGGGIGAVGLPAAAARPSLGSSSRLSRSARALLSRTSGGRSSGALSSSSAAAAAAAAVAATAPPPPAGVSFDLAEPPPLDSRHSSSVSSPESLRSSKAAESLRSSSMPTERSSSLRGWLRSSARSLTDGSLARRSAPAATTYGPSTPLAATRPSAASPRDATAPPSASAVGTPGSASRLWRRDSASESSGGRAQRQRLGRLPAGEASTSTYDVSLVHRPQAQSGAARFRSAVLRQRTGTPRCGPPPTLPLAPTPRRSHKRARARVHRLAHPVCPPRSLPTPLRGSRIEIVFSDSSTCRAARRALAHALGQRWLPAAERTEQPKPPVFRRAPPEHGPSHPPAPGSSRHARMQISLHMSMCMHMHMHRACCTAGARRRGT